MNDDKIYSQVQRRCGVAMSYKDQGGLSYGNGFNLDPRGRWCIPLSLSILEESGKGETLVVDCKTLATQ